MEPNTLLLLIGIGAALGFIFCLVKEKAQSPLATLPPEEAQFQRRRNLILGSIKPRREASGRVNEEDFTYSTMLQRYQLSFVLSQQQEGRSFQFGPEPAQATQNVINSSSRARISIERRCREEFQIDIYQLALGNKEAADLLSQFRKNNL